jgi:tetratricopeptide (TPR) repeat protein
MNPDLQTFAIAALVLVICGAGVAFILFGLSPIPATEGDFDAVNYYNSGVDLAEKGMYEEALKATEKALSIKQNFIPAWIQKAGLLNVLGRYEDAIAATDKALTLKPNSSEAWANRADALNNLGRYSEALNASTRALTIDPNLTEAKLSRSYAESMLAAAANVTGNQNLQNRTAKSR